MTKYFLVGISYGGHASIEKDKESQYLAGASLAGARY
jgi:hypothetical protein